MEGEKKRRGGWWALAGVVLLTLLGLYVGAYYALVVPSYSQSEVWNRLTNLRRKRPRVAFKPQPRIPAYHEAWLPLPFGAEQFFLPIHLMDRLVRPKFWGPQPP